MARALLHGKDKKAGHAESRKKEKDQSFTKIAFQRDELTQVFYFDFIHVNFFGVTKLGTNLFW